MSASTTPAVQRMAATLRNELNVCGDDRGCQCEDSIRYSEDIARLMATDLLSDVQEMARVLFLDDHPDMAELWDAQTHDEPSPWHHQAEAMNASLLGGAA